LAAEIAVSSVVEKTSPFMKIARKLLSSQRFAPIHISELASALATVELFHGYNKAARKLFRGSLHSPTENAVAQAEWASRQISGLELEPGYLDVPLSFEARAWDAYQAQHWNEALSEAASWHADQPFSRRPPLLGSFIASTILDEFEQAVKIARAGLISNPADPMLINNLVYSLARANRPDEAAREFSKIIQPVGDLTLGIVLTATEGLILIKQGLWDEGRKHYMQAIADAEENSLGRLKTMAAINLAREELSAGLPAPDTALELASQSALQTADPIASLLVKRLIDKADRHSGDY
jgi:tetratricopeptide (TPR) repeat protein